MTIEFLYPELCNLYGDRGNMDYLLPAGGYPPDVYGGRALVRAA